MLVLRYYLWFAPNALLAVCLVRVLRRGLQKIFPLFTTYLILQLALFIAGFTTSLLVLHSLASRSTYLWVAVTDVGLSAVCELAVFYEVAMALFSRSSAMEILRPLLRWTAGMLVLLSVVLSALLSRAGIERLMNVFQPLDFSVNLVAIGLLLVMILFTQFLSVSWRGILAGVVLGFGVLAASDVAASPLLSLLGRKGYITVDLIRMTGFHTCALIWLVYLFPPERPVASSSSTLQMSELEVHLQELQRMTPH